MKIDGGVLRDTLEPFIVGGLSCSIATSITHPLRMANIRRELWTKPLTPKTSAVRALFEIVKNGKGQLLFSGFSDALLRQAISGSARVGFYGIITKALRGSESDSGSEKLTNLSFRTKAISATVSGILAAGFATPLDICMQRIHSDRYIQSSSRSKIEKLPTNQASSMI